MNEKINFKENEFGYIEYKSKNPYEFYQIFNELDEAETQDSFGWLIFPEQGKKPYPVVVCAHGSDNWAGHHHEHILNFLNNGIAVFKAHSFDSRGVASTIEDQLSVTTAMMMVDVVEPLKFLSRHPDLDANKIAITGWSLGGMVAFYTAWEPIMEKLASNGERFCAHLPFYPPTFLNPDEHRWSKAPILNLIGSDDDYTPGNLVKDICKEMKNMLKSKMISLYLRSNARLAESCLIECETSKIETSRKCESSGFSKVLEIDICSSHHCNSKLNNYHIVKTKRCLFQISIKIKIITINSKPT